LKNNDCVLKRSLGCQKLLGHQDEVWHVQFSHSGDRLASASKDRSAIIWAVPPNGDARMLLTLKGHPDSVTHLSWSRDDTKLLTCSSVQVPEILSGHRSSCTLTPGKAGCS
jgi:WD40 repeat protein